MYLTFSMGSTCADSPTNNYLVCTNDIELTCNWELGVLNAGPRLEIPSVWLVVFESVAHMSSKKMANLCCFYWASEAESDAEVRDPFQNESFKKTANPSFLLNYYWLGKRGKKRQQVMMTQHTS